MRGKIFYEISELIGDVEAEKFCKAFGGMRYYIPKNNKEHKFKTVISNESFIKLCEGFGGEWIYIPNLRKNVDINIKVVEMLKQGHSLREVAKECHICVSHVSSYRRKIKNNLL